MKNPKESRVLSSKYRPCDQIKKKHQPQAPKILTESGINFKWSKVCQKLI
jgi:hypothetical protein